MDKVTYAYVIGAEFAASLVLHLASICLTWKTLRYFLISRKNAISVVGSKVSVFLIVLLIAWLFTSLSYVPKEIYILSVWRPQENLRNGVWIFWSYMPSLCQYSTVPVFVLFLTLDRIFVIQMNIRYQNNEFVKRVLLAVCFLLAAAIWLANFFQFIQNLPISSKTECWTFTCLVDNGAMNFYLSSRLVVAIPNCIGGLVFFWLLWKLNSRLMPNQASTYDRQRIRANRYNNLLTLWAICSEFLLNFVPYFLPLLIQTLTGVNVVANVGVFASMLSAVEGLIFVCIYSRVLRRLDKDSSSMSIVHNYTQKAAKSVVKRSANDRRIPQVQ